MTTRTNEKIGGNRPAMIGLSLSMLMASLDTSIANAGLPALAKAFGASFPAVQWIVLAYLLAVTSLVVSAGKLGDVIGRRRLLLIGISLFTVASALCGGATTLSVLIAARAVQGLGAAIMMALTLPFVGEIAPKEKFGAAMGLLGTMSAIGTALGPSLGGLLTSGLGWRSIFLINVPIGIANLLLANRHLPADHPAPDAAPARFDLPGTILLGLSLAAYALAMTLGKGSFGPLNGGLLIAAVLGGASFVLVQKRQPSPLVQTDLFKDRVIGTGLLMHLLVAAVVMSTLVVGPFYLSRALGLDAERVGFILSVGPIVVALSGIPAGRLVDRFGSQRLIVVGLAGMLIGTLALSVVPVVWNIPGYLLPIMMLTAGYAIFQTANNGSIMSSGGPERRGTVSGLLSLSRNLGLITGASLMGAVFAFGTGTDAIATAHPNEVGHGLHVTFTLAAALMAVSLGTALTTRRTVRA